MHKWRPPPPQKKWAVSDLSWAPQSWHPKQTLLVGQRIGGINRRTVRSLDSADECAQAGLCRNRAESVGSNGTGHLAPRQLPRQTPQPEPRPRFAVPPDAGTHGRGPLGRRATVAAEPQGGVWAGGRAPPSLRWPRQSTGGRASLSAGHLCSLSPGPPRGLHRPFLLRPAPVWAAGAGARSRENSRSEGMKRLWKEFDREEKDKQSW